MDRICYNGTLMLPSELEAGAGQLLEANYLYQQIHTYDLRPDDLPAHLDILNAAMEAMYRIRFETSPARIEADITACLRANRYSPGQSASVMLRVFPHGFAGANERAATEKERAVRPTPRIVWEKAPVASPVPGETNVSETILSGRAASAKPDPVRENTPPAYLIECREQLYYKGYTVWHKRPVLAVFPCEYLFMGYPTAISRHVANYSREAARQMGADVAVVENRDGTLTNVEDEPLFLAFGKEVFTSPLQEGATDSVMRRKMIETCLAEGISLSEYPLTRSMLDRCDEAFYPTVQGLTVIHSYSDRLYYNFTAPRLIRHF